MLAGGGKLLPHHHQAGRIVERQRAQQDGMNDAKNGGVSANSQSDGHYRNHGKAWALAQLPKREAQVLKNSGHKSPH